MNRRHYLLGVGLAASTVLAGCQSGTTDGETGTQSGTTTTDATPDTTPTTEDPKPDPFPLPSGFSSEGVTDAAAVAEGHLSALEGTSYTVTLVKHFEHPWSTFVGQFDRASNRGHIREQDGEAEWYFDDEHWYVKQSDDSDSYDVRSVDDSDQSRYLGTLEWDIFPLLDDFTYAPSPEFRTIDGEPVATFSMTGARKGRLSVSPQGRVYRIRVEKYEELQFEYETTDVGSTTVTEPDWVAGASA